MGVLHPGGQIPASSSGVFDQSKHLQVLGFVAYIADSLIPCVDTRHNREQKRVFETEDILLFCMDIVNHL